MYRDGQGRLWAGTQNEGLKRWDEATGRFDGFAHAAGNPATLADDHVSSLYQDRSGSLWVGTWFAGISRVDLRGSGFAHVAAAQPGAPGSLSSNKITGILGDGVDGLWLSTYGGGLNRLDLRDGSVRVVRHRAGVPSSLNDDLVSCLARDRTGQLWVGTRSGGFGRFDPASGRFTARPRRRWCRFRPGHRAGPREHPVDRHPRRFCTASTRRQARCAATVTIRPTRPAWQTTSSGACWKTAQAGSGSAPRTAWTCWIGPAAASVTRATIRAIPQASATTGSPTCWKRASARCGWAPAPG
nr:two-component regulator propeller domain-containing protein [Massilia sp. Dwa41.01b]